MIPYDQIDIDAPVAHAFKARGLPVAEFLISLGAVVGITSAARAAARRRACCSRWRATVSSRRALSRPSIRASDAAQGHDPDGFVVARSRRSSR
jgi:hypothetical protein